MSTHIVPEPFRASHMIRDAERLGLYRSCLVIAGCPSCARDATLDVDSGAIRCRHCGAVTTLCAFVDGATEPSQGPLDAQYAERTQTEAEDDRGREYGC